VRDRDFLRGFDADHGTDVALFVDGVPVNMVSHGHGQGSVDLNWVIPELIERVEVSKGPYFARHGDFATAGAINLVTRRRFESHPLLEFRREWREMASKTTFGTQVRTDAIDSG
jgi:outer membrane receptor for ferrienterochelin and colicin